MVLAFEQVTLEAARLQGWDVAVVGEARLALALTRAGLDRAAWELQFKLGPYRLDFAHPLYRLDIEADGWVHTARKNRQRDRERDKQLQSWGWDVIRVETDYEDAVTEAARHIRAVVVATPRYGQALYREGMHTAFRGPR